MNLQDFDELEIQECRWHPDFGWDPVEGTPPPLRAGELQVWTLFGHYGIEAELKGREAICDCATKGQAEWLSDILVKQIGE